MGKKAAKDHAKSKNKPRVITLEPKPGGLDKSPRLAMEQLNRALGKMLEGKDFANVDEMNRYLQEHISGRRIDEIVDEIESDPAEQAQELAYRAIEAPTREEALDLARQALKLDPGCLDAQVTVALAEAKTSEEAIGRLREVLRQFEEKIGPEAMKETQGYFWSAVETRPYMRARAELLKLLLEAGRTEEAIAEAEGLVRLNPGDNQGIRYTLLGLYLQHGQVAEAGHLLEQYADEASAFFAWGRVLQRLLAGEAEAARAAFAQAMKVNKYFFEFMTGRRALPKSPPAYYGFGDANEGAYCVRTLGMAWLSHPQALAWLKQQKK